VRVLSLGESESSRKVLGEVGDTSDSGDDGLVDGFLVGSLLGGESLLLLLSVLEELSLSSRSLSGLRLGEVSVVELGVELKLNKSSVFNFLWYFLLEAPISFPVVCLLLLDELYTHLERSEVNLGRGSDNVGLVDATKGDTVDLERSSNEEETGGELSENDDALSTESTGEEDYDGTGDDRGTKLGGLVRLARDLGLTDVVSRVVRGLLSLGGRSLSGSGRLGLTLVQTLLGVDLAARELADVRRDVGVAGHLFNSFRFEVVTEIDVRWRLRVRDGKLEVREIGGVN